MDFFLAKKEKSEVQVSEVLTKGEQASIASRREVVRNNLAKHGIQCSLDKIPNIAVLGSGGGMRAMIALYGTLTELKKCNLLDCVMYLCGVSGSTWCMSSIYKNENWSENIETLEKLLREKLVKGKWDIIKAKKACLEAARDENYSLTDFWAYFIVYKMIKELDNSKLSEQKTSCENGKNPYPIYAAVNKHTYSRYEAGSWFEFTPHNTGVAGINGDLSTGAYVDMKDLGSIFIEGQLNEKKKEKTICYLQGLWGSALASEKEIKKAIIEALLDFLKIDRESYFPSHLKDLELQKLNVLSQAYQQILELQLCTSDVGASKAEGFFDLLENILKFNKTSKSYQVLQEMRQNWSSSDADTREKACIKLWETLNKDFGGPAEKLIPLALNPLKRIAKPLKPLEKLVPPSPFQGVKDWIRHIHKTNSCILTWTWGTTSNFLFNLEDVKVPDLKKKELVSLIDAGLAINSAYPLVLDPERHVKLILSFDYSAGDPFETVKRTAEYCKVRGIKFPRIEEHELQDKDNPSNCYIFRGDDLTVMHFPLFNTVNCQNKIAEYRNTFSTFKLSYSEEEIGKLLIAAKKNVADVQQKILEEIKHIVDSPSSIV